MPTAATESRLSRIFGTAPQSAPTARDLLRGNKALAPSVNQSMVLLSFAEPIPRARAAEFLRIHLTDKMTKGGEDQPYMAEIFQPDRVGVQLCPRCAQPMRRLSLAYTRCENSACENGGRRNVNGPMLGVIEVMVTPEQIVEVGAAGVQWVSGCLLVLDRRYSDVVLSQVYRTAGTLCEVLGWRLV